MTNGQIAKLLKGRTIKRVLLRAFQDGRGSWTADPEFVLDDGSTVSFVVHETESGEYGIDLTLYQGRG